MATRISPIYQRDSLIVTLSKNAKYTQPSSDGLLLTAWLIAENGTATDVTVGTPTGVAADTNVTVEIDVLTGITITGPTWYSLVIVDEDGRNLLPNGVMQGDFLIELYPQPSA